MSSKRILAIAIAAVLLMAMPMFADGNVATSFVQSSGTLNVQHTVSPVYSGPLNQISANLTVNDIAGGSLNTNFQTKNWWCGDRQVGSQQLSVSGFSPGPSLGNGMTYVVDYTQVSDHPFQATTQTTGNYQATIDNSWQNRGRQNTGANIAVNGGGWVETELDWTRGTATAELATSGGTGYVEMRTNTEDWGDMTGIPTTYRAFGEVSASGTSGYYSISGQTKGANQMDYKVVGLVDGTTAFTTRGDNLSGPAFVNDWGNFSSSLDIEDNQQIVKRAWSGPDGVWGNADDNVSLEAVGFDIDFNAIAKEHYELYGPGGPW